MVGVFRRKKHEKITYSFTRFINVLSLAGCGSQEEQTPTEKSTLTFEISTLFIVPDLTATQNVQDEMNRYLAEIGKNYEIKFESYFYW